MGNCNFKAEAEKEAHQGKDLLSHLIWKSHLKLKWIEKET